MIQIRFVGSLSATTNRGTPGDEKRQYSAKPGWTACQEDGQDAGKKMA
jgi:hypothetical protein